MANTEIRYNIRSNTITLPTGCHKVDRHGVILEIINRHKIQTSIVTSKMLYEKYMVPDEFVSVLERLLHSWDMYFKTWPAPADVAGWGISPDTLNTEIPRVHELLTDIKTKKTSSIVKGDTTIELQERAVGSAHTVDMTYTAPPLTTKIRLTYSGKYSLINSNPVYFLGPSDELADLISKHASKPITVSVSNDEDSIVRETLNVQARSEMLRRAFRAAEQGVRYDTMLALEC